MWNSKMQMKEKFVEINKAERMKTVDYVNYTRTAHSLIEFFYPTYVRRLRRRAYT